MREASLGPANATCPDSHIIFLSANILLLVKVGYCDTRNGLDHLLQENIPNYIPACDVVPFQDFGGGVKAVVRKEVVDINEVIDHRQRPISDNWKDQCQDIVGNRREKGRARSQRVLRERRVIGDVGCIDCHGRGTDNDSVIEKTEVGKIKASTALQRKEKCD
jgi:hypothetical protein